MKQFELIPATDVRLNSISEIVGEKAFSGTRLQRLADEMKHVAMSERDEEHPNLPTLVGLAAPQIGVFERVILFDNKATGVKPNFDPDFHIVVNPQITAASDERELGREGCYSTGDVRAVVRRHSAVSLVGYDVAGNQVVYKLEGFQARIVQHEVDHLNGVRCPDRIESPHHLHLVSAEEFQDYREHWETWDKYYPIEDWLTTKRGEGK